MTLELEQAGLCEFKATLVGLHSLFLELDHKSDRSRGVINGVTDGRGRGLPFLE